MNKINYKKFLKITQLTKLWGIGNQTDLRLQKLRIYKVQHIINTPEEILYDEFGIKGLELQKHVMLIDASSWKRKTEKLNFHEQMIQDLVPQEKSIGQGQTLNKDYVNEEIKVIIHDMTLNVVLKLTKRKYLTKRVALSLNYSSKNLEERYNKGFSRQLTLSEHTCDFKVIYQAILILFDKNYIWNNPVRMVSLSIGKLVKNDVVKSEILDVMNQYDSKDKPKIFFANQLNKESNFINRYSKLGGHKK